MIIIHESKNICVLWHHKILFSHSQYFSCLAMDLEMLREFFMDPCGCSYASKNCIFTPKISFTPCFGSGDVERIFHCSKNMMELKNSLTLVLRRYLLWTLHQKIRRSRKKYVQRFNGRSNVSNGHPNGYWAYSMAVYYCPSTLSKGSTSKYLAVLN